RRIPMRFLWLPLAKLQDGLGGKARAIGLSIAAAVVALVAVMIFVPYPLKMDSKGQLLPRERRWVFSPVEGQVMEFKVQPNSEVQRNDDLVRMRDVQLGRQVVQLVAEMEAAEQAIRAKDLDVSTAPA